MTRSLKWASIVAILACPALARANIGDDLTQLRSHYGSVSIMGPQLLFEVRMVDGKLVPARGTVSAEDHFSVTVYINDDRSAMEVFTRNTSDPVKANLSQKDIDTFLDAAADGQTWTSVSVKSGHPTWVRSDKKLVARFSPNSTGKPDDASVLVIMLNTK